MRLLILTLLLSTASFGQALKDRIAILDKPKDVTVTYDSFRDVTTVKSKQFVSKATKKSRTRSSSIGVVGAFEFSGNTMMSYVDYIWLHFDTANYDWTYQNDHNLIVLADNTRLELGEGVREEVHGIAGHGFVSEKLSFKLARSDYANIVNAKIVEIRLGPFEGTIDESGIAKLRNIFTLSTLSAK